MKALRRREGGIDCGLRNAVIEGVEEADILAGIFYVRRDPFQRAGGAGEIRAVIDDGDLIGRGFEILHGVLLEEMHPGGSPWCWPEILGPPL